MRQSHERPEPSLGREKLCTRKRSTLSAPSLELEFGKLYTLHRKAEAKIALRLAIPTPTSLGLHRPLRRAPRLLEQNVDSSAKVKKKLVKGDERH